MSIKKWMIVIAGGIFVTIDVLLFLYFVEGWF
jgi:hypothetical protein